MDYVFVVNKPIAVVGLTSWTLQCLAYNARSLSEDPAETLKWII
jgi:hypothetical protein